MPLENQSAPEGSKEETSGSSESSTQKVDNNDQDYNPEFVQKVLKEKKNYATKAQQIQEENEALRKQLEQIKEQDLKNKEEYKTLYENKLSEVNEWKEKYTSQQKEIENGIKRSQLRNELTKLGIKPAYLEKAVNLADLNYVKYDSDAKLVLGADDQARLISEEWKDLFGGNQSRPNHDSPDINSKNGAITLEEWKKLPFEEQKKRMKDVAANMGLELKK